MRFLVDENLSPRLCQLIATPDDTVEHVTDALGPGASDREIMAYAIDDGAVVLTADTDFGALLARGGQGKPSVVLVRELLSLPVAGQGRLLAANLGQVRDVLTNGAIVVLSPHDIRVRPLPIVRSRGRSDPGRDNA
jgi:predicted nuclease of predicted toxin-antitoxin system